MGQYDVIVIGGGPAGYTAALYCARAALSTLVLEAMAPGGQMGTTDQIDNYPGFADGINGFELAMNMQKQAERFGAESVFAQVSSMDLKGPEKKIYTEEGDTYTCRAVILALGASPRELGLPEESTLRGRGVSYCATCDGALYKGKRIAVICNDARFEHEVAYLAELAEQLIYFPQYRGSSIQAGNVTVSAGRPVKVEGESRAERLVLQDGQILPVDGIFILRNAIAPDTLLRELQTEGGHIVVNRRMETNLRGCYAAGDCTGRPYQYTKAVGEGNVAAHSIIEYLASLQS